MNRIFLSLAPLALGFAVGAGAQTPPPNKVAVLNIQAAIAGTQDGQKASADLQARYEPKRKEMEKKQSEIAALRDQLSRGSNTMSEDAKNTLTRDIDARTKALNRDSEDASADFQQDQNKVLNELGGRIMAVIDKYARDNGYTVVLDVGSQQTPVIWASDAIDITNDIVALYDKNSPAKPGAAPAVPAAAKPLAPAKPPATPPVKK